MYKTKEEAYRQLNFDLVVVRADKLLEQRNELLEQLYGSMPQPHSKVTQEDYSAGHIVIVKIYSGVFIGKVKDLDNEYVTLSSCMKIMGCNMGVAASELDNPEKFPCTSIIKVF